MISNQLWDAAASKSQKTNRRAQARDDDLKWFDLQLSLLAQAPSCPTYNDVFEKSILSCSMQDLRRACHIPRRSRWYQYG